MRARPPLARYFSEYKPLGVLIIMLEEMTLDLLNFAIFFTITTVSFSMSLWGLQLAGLYAIAEDVAPLDADGSPNVYDAFHNEGAFWAPLCTLIASSGSNRARADRRRP